MASDTDTAVAIARMDERMRSIDDRLEELLELERANARRQEERNERLVLLEHRLETELKRSTESGERCSKMLDDIELRLRAVEARPVPEAPREDRDLKPDTGVHEQLTAAQVQESKARTKVWNVISTMFGGLIGALTTWLATKK